MDSNVTQCEWPARTTEAGAVAEIRRVHVNNDLRGRGALREAGGLKTARYLIVAPLTGRGESGPRRPHSSPLRPRHDVQVPSRRRSRPVARRAGACSKGRAEQGFRRLRAVAMGVSESSSHGVQESIGHDK